MHADRAEIIGLKALTWLLDNEELLPVFMGATGVSGDEMAERAQDPAFLISILDFLMMDDQWVITFCNAEGLAYDIPMQARQMLPGGAQINWT